MSVLFVECSQMSERGTERKLLGRVKERDMEETINCSIRNPSSSVSFPVLLVCLSIIFKLCLLYLSAPLTDKPPKILFPSENKISNMELQLGKSIMGFPPAAVGTICVIFKWHEMDDFTNPLQHTTGTECRLMMTLLFAGESAKEKQLFKCFPYMQMVHANVPRLFCQQLKAHMVPGFRTLARHMERRPLSVATVCLLWRGVTTVLPCVHACMNEYKRVVVFVLGFFLWQHIAWFLGTVRCPHGTCRSMNG